MNEMKEKAQYDVNKQLNEQGWYDYDGDGLRNKKERIFGILQLGNHTDTISRACDVLIISLILINIVVSICFTFEGLRRYFSLFRTIEIITVIFFAIELVLRLWTADFLYGMGKIKSALRYLISFNGIVEFWSIIPFFLPIIFPKGIIAFRVFRVVRMLRLFQVNTYSDAMSTIFIVVKRKRNQILSSMVMIFVVMVMASMVMYGFEHNAQPEVFENAFSGLWWATSALLTVGYGDIYPVTPWGEAASILITFLGVGMVAIPTGILSAGFTEYEKEQKTAHIMKQKARYAKEHKKLDYCPYCGEKLPNHIGEVESAALKILTQADGLAYPKSNE